MAFNILTPFLALLMIDALIEMGSIASMVSYLHIAHHDVPFHINSPQGSFRLSSKPVHLWVNQGHTSNGAAGTALLLVGLLGFIVLWHQGRRERSNRASGSSLIMTTWTVLTVLSFLLTLVALIYTFVVTNMVKDQTINTAVALAYSGKSYPANNWTPEIWYKRMLELDFADPSQKSDIRTHYYLMVGWRYNLIPLLVLGAVVMGLAVRQTLKDRRRNSNRDSTASSWLQKPSPRVGF